MRDSTAGAFDEGPREEHARLAVRGQTLIRIEGTFAGEPAPNRSGWRWVGDVPAPPASGTISVTMLLSPPTLERFFHQAVPYESFVASGEPMGHRPPWDQRYGQLALDESQQALVSSFVRPMKVLTLTGTWCGDCALQGAAMQRIAEANECIDLRYILRTEEHAELIVPSQINAGFRVPVTWFMAEDFEPLSRIGDRPLSRYRSMARKALGDAAIAAPPAADPVRTVLQEMLDEFERTQLLLRLSPRWKEKYGD